LESTLIFGRLIFGRREIAFASPLLRPFFEAERANPPAAPAIAAPPATSGTFALPAALRTASTFELLLADPFVEPLDFAFGAFGFDVDFAAGVFLDLDFGFALAFVFVWAIVPLLAAVP
jgi:hypothetical protein